MTDRRRVAQANQKHNAGQITADVIVEADEATGGQVKRVRIQGQNPHDRYRDQGLIDSDQHAAADAMLKDYDLAGLETLRGQSWSREDQSIAEMSDVRIDAKARLLHSLAACEPVGASVVLKICCEGQTARDVAAALGLPKQFVIPRLTESLDTIGALRGLTGVTRKR